MGPLFVSSRAPSILIRAEPRLPRTSMRYGLCSSTAWANEARKVVPVAVVPSETNQVISFDRTGAVELGFDCFGPAKPCKGFPAEIHGAMDHVSKAIGGWSRQKRAARSRSSGQPNRPGRSKHPGEASMRRYKFPESHPARLR